MMSFFSFVSFESDYSIISDSLDSLIDKVKNGQINGFFSYQIDDIDLAFIPFINMSLYVNVNNDNPLFNNQDIEMDDLRNMNIVLPNVLYSAYAILIREAEERSDLNISFDVYDSINQKKYLPAETVFIAKYDSLVGVSENIKQIPFKNKSISYGCYYKELDDKAISFLKIMSLRINSWQRKVLKKK